MPYARARSEKTMRHAAKDPMSRQEAGGRDGGLIGSSETTHQAKAKPLTLLSVIIPAKDEEGCIGSTVEHLYVELRLRNVPHEIVVVDDGSTDATWQALEQARTRIPTLAPVKNIEANG